MVLRPAAAEHSTELCDRHGQRVLPLPANVNISTVNVEEGAVARVAGGQRRIVSGGCLTRGVVVHSQGREGKV